MTTLAKSVKLNHQGFNIGDYEYRDQTGKLRFLVHAYGPTCSGVTEHTEYSETGLNRFHGHFRCAGMACRFVEGLDSIGLPDDQLGDAAVYLSRCRGRGKLLTAAPDVTLVLPRISRFDGTGAYAAEKKRRLDALQDLLLATSW